MSTPHERIGEVIFFRLARRVTGARWLVLSSSLVTTLVLGWAALTRLQFDNSAEGLLGESSPTVVTLRQLGDHFGHDKLFLIAAEGDVFSPDFLTRLTALHERVAALELDLESLGMRHEPRRRSVRGEDEPTQQSRSDGRHVVRDIHSLVNATELESTEQGLALRYLLRPLPLSDALPGLRERVLTTPSLVDHVVSGNGRMAVVVVRTDFMSEADTARVYDALHTILDESRSDTFALRLTGVGALQVALNHAILRDITVVAGICLVAMVSILTFLFRGLFGVLAPLLVVLQAVVWTLGGMALLGAPVTSVSSVLAALLVCVGMADSIHVQTAFRDFRRDGIAPRDAAVKALADTGVPVLMASLTTIAALISLRTASLAAVVDMGTYGALGAAAAMTLTMVFLPAFLTLHGESRLGAQANSKAWKSTTPDLLDRFIAGCDATSRPVVRDGQRRYGRRNVTLLVSLLIALGSVLGIAQLEGRHDPLTWLPEDDEARMSLEAVDRTVAGTATVELLISAPRGQTLLHHDVMRRLEALENHVLAFRRAGREDERVVTNVSSVLNVLRQGLRAGALEPDAYGLPTSEQGLIDVFTRIDAAGVPSLRQLITPDARHAVMSLRVHWLEASAYASLREHITRGIREHIGTAAHVELTGSAYANSEVANALIDTLSKSFLAALGIIALLMVVMLADFKLGIVAMLPNLLPIMVVGGVVGALGVPLDLNTILVASIAIGIAVDDTIHFFYRFHAHEPQLGSEGAIAASFLSTARAVIATSAVLALGFTAFAFAEMVSIRRFGLLIMACIAVAMLAELVLTPALLRAVYGRSRDAEKAEPEHRAE